MAFKQYDPITLQDVQDELDNKADESSRLRAIKKSVTSGTWAYDSLLYLGLHAGESAIVSIETSSGYAVPATIPNDPMWYAAVYDGVGNKVSTGTFTLKVTYMYKGIEL